MSAVATIRMKLSTRRRKAWRGAVVVILAYWTKKLIH
ncbi:unnamed protein product [Brassica rapa]|uniref:Uncharacterized protein n=2 Tax=Brassica TaxID=3705 RepID=A0A8D9HZL6_BRACM|nr:unnamed protein product [Brassica napus]CAG7908375.1 unnamed protein product [Brassica rapa]